ncbi:hypothetical protein QCA50_017050, partial [Cerrena zonata]
MDTSSTSVTDDNQETYREVKKDQLNEDRVNVFVELKLMIHKLKTLEDFRMTYYHHQI